jgi:hypothetical protein
MPTLSWRQLDNLADKKPRFRKEAIYAGEFNKDGDRFSVSKRMLQRLAASVTELRKAGVDIPLANGHEDWMNAATRLGDVVDASVENNEEGIPALYIDIEFANEDAANIATKADVSIGYLGEFQDGRGVVHKQVLRHVAATSAPVVPSLGDWAALAASFNKSNSMSKILEHLGVDSEDLALEAIKALQAKPVVEEKVELSYPPMMVEAMKDLRVKQLDLSVQSGEIGPVVRDKLAERFATDKTVALELSHNSDGGDFKNALELAKLASKNPPVPTHGRSSQPGKGEVTLGHNGQRQTGLAAIISEMAEEFKAGRK